VTAQGTPGVYPGEAYQGSGGGSGGSVQIITTNLKGNGHINIRGGDGSDGGGGGGSGGRLVLLLLRSFRATAQPEQSGFWTGSFDHTGGVSGASANGTGYLLAAHGQTGTVSHDKCFGGYTGVFCTACAIGTYKYDYSFAQCTSCDNKPMNSYYVGEAMSSAVCSYECSEGLDPFDVNPNCENALALSVERLGGSSGSLLYFSFFLVLCLMLWTCLIHRSNAIQKDMGEFNSTVYDGILFNEEEYDPVEEVLNPRNLRM